MTVDDLERLHHGLLSECIEFAPPEGWVGLVAEVLTDLDAIGGVKVGQIKSKLAQLRVYASAEDEYKQALVDAIVAAAEKRSEALCEVCGEPGVCTERGWWLSVKCEAHR